MALPIDEIAAAAARQSRNLMDINSDSVVDVPCALSALIIQAARDSEPTLTIKSLHEEILAHSLVSEIDIFTVVPLLLNCDRDFAEEFLYSLVDQCSAKEMIIALQEAAERLIDALNSDTPESDSEEEEIGSGENEASIPQQSIRIVKLFVHVVPRLSKAKKTPAQILQSPFSQLQALVQAAGQAFNEAETAETLRTLNALATVVATWADRDENVVNLVYDLVVSVLQTCSNTLGTRVASSAFAEIFPRLVSSQSASTSLDAPPDPVAELNDTLQSIGLEPMKLSATLTASSLTSLLFIAHTPSSTRFSIPDPMPQTAFPLIIASIHSNTALPSMLALLLRILGPIATLKTTSPDSIPPGVLSTLSELLPQIASMHTNPLIRHIAFRLLSLSLSLTPSVVRIQTLRALVCPDEIGLLDNMMVASVGLVKESVLEALSLPEKPGEKDVFATPMFTEIFLPVLFVPRFPLLTQTGDNPERELEIFLQSSEPSRLVEVLGLYYLLLKRDTENKTGIRTPNVTQRLRTTLLDGIKEKLEGWDCIDLEDAEDAKMQLGILEMWLDRLEETLG